MPEFSELKSLLRRLADTEFKGSGATDGYRQSLIEHRFTIVGPRLLPMQMQPPGR